MQSKRKQTKPQANNKRAIKGGLRQWERWANFSRNAAEDEENLVSKNEGKQY